MVSNIIRGTFDEEFNSYIKAGFCHKKSIMKKKITVILILLFAGVSLIAQDHHHDKDEHKEIRKEYKILKGLKLSHGKDTVLVDATLADTLSRRRFIINQKWKEKESYTLLIPKGQLTDIYGATNDSLNLMITTWEERDYGTIIINANIQTTKGQWLFQLMTEKDVLLRELIAHKGDKIKFAFLAPGKYTVKMIYDENSNGVWDTGKYLKKALRK